jgi:hypothetical protein
VLSGPWRRRPRRHPGPAPAGPKFRPFLERLEDRTLLSTAIPLSAANWTSIGPSSLSAGVLYSGRITAIAGDPTNANILYIAAAGGGVWKTINGGGTWAPLTDATPTAFMGALAVAPSNPQVVYAGTGEANLGPSKLAIARDNIYYGLGVLKSTDGGATWVMAGAAPFYRRTISRIVVDPTNANVVYVAVGAVAYNGLPGNTGIWKSVDGGATWVDTTLGISTTAAFSDLAIDPTNNLVLYAAVGNPYGDLANGIYKSVDGGNTWGLLFNYPHGSTDVRVGRITLAVAKTAPQIVYAAVEADGLGGSALGSLLAMGKSGDGGASWVQLVNTPNYMVGFGDYNTTLAVDPTNANIVYAAGQAGPDTLIRSLDGGNTWGDIDVGVNGQGPHVDHHAAAFDALGRFLDGNDGGIWRLDNPSPGGLQWTDLNGNLGTLQLTGIALHPTNPNIAYGGAQDNGTEEFNNNAVWGIVQGGDGGFVHVDPTIPTTVYHTFFYGGPGFLERSDDGGATWTGMTSGIDTNDPAHFYPPYVLDPLNPSRLLLGTNRVYETLNRAEAWTPLSAPGVAGWTTSAVIDSVAATTNLNVIYAAAGGHVFVTVNHGASWVQTDPVPNAPPTLRYGDILADPNNPSIAYVVASNFDDMTGGGHVWVTTNAGGTWINISGNIPEVPAWSIALDEVGFSGAKIALFVGTDNGVYVTTTLGAVWTRLSHGLPYVQVTDLKFNPFLGILGAATDGRGMWELAIPHTDPIVAVGADFGGPPVVTVFNAATGAPKFSFFAYDPHFLGGVRVAVGDVNGDGVPDIITAPGLTGGPDVRVFDGATGALIREFMAFAPGFLGGVNVAAGDVNGDGFADIITGADAGGGPQVKVFSGSDGSVLQSFFAFSPAFAGGVRVAAGDVEADGLADIVTAAGPGGGPQVKVFRGLTGQLLQSYFAFNPAFAGGVYVAAGDINGDGHADVVTGAGPGGGPVVSVFSGVDGSLLQSFFAYSVAFAGGVRVAVGNVDGDGLADIITGPGPQGGPQVIARDGLSLAVLASFFAYPPAFVGGIYVGGIYSSQV